MSVDLGALGPIAARKAMEAETLRCAAAGLWAKVETLPPAQELVPTLRGGAVIAEMKRRSPSGGTLRADLRPADAARAFESATPVPRSVSGRMRAPISVFVCG